ncbi:hypothetical protein Q4R69_18035, partial [Morganella morganii subsp. sibonii]
MATIPTQNAVPSEAPRDLKFNSGKIDEFVTSLEHEYKDRFGRCHMTIEGMRWIFDQLMERFKVDINQAIIAAGYIPMDSFQQGAEITKRNEILRDETTGEYYRWDGDLPKSVPAGSTPVSAGGVGVGAWVSVGDASLRSELSADDGLSMIGGCESVNHLKSIRGNKHGDQVFLKSYHAGKNKGGDIFRWDASSVSPDDGGCIIKPDEVTTGRWVRVEHDRYTPEMYGADGTKENDPDAIERLLLNQKRVLFPGVYYYNREFVTNGHDVEGGTTGEFWGDGAASKIIFFGGFNSPQAVRNEITKSSYRNMTFEPESWDSVTGYTGTGLRVGRAIDAECCNWFKFKQFGMDLWASITDELVHYPYGSQFRNCKWEYNGWAGIRFTNGANSVQIYGGSAGWNGSPSYGEKPSDSSSGWDGILITKLIDGSVPPMDNEFDIQGNIIEGIDCSYNARYGFNADYANQSIFNIGYSEANFGPVDTHVRDVVACTINVLVSQRGEDIDVPNYPISMGRSVANHPNSIVISGVDYASGSKDGEGRYITWRAPKYSNIPISVGSLGNSGFRSYGDKSGAFETYSDGDGSPVLIRANSGSLPLASEKYLGTLWRDTSIG